MRRITTEMFEKSHFSIGGGFDLEPFKRFTHLTDIFINMNLYINEKKVTEWYDKAFEVDQSIEVLAKEVYPNFDAEALFELEPNYTSYAQDFSFMKPNQLASFKEAFHYASSQSFVVYYELYRPDVNRKFSYYFCASEGLSAYLAMSHNGKFAPKILSTIMTGVLENPDSLMNTLFEKRIQKLPELWVRGFEPHSYFDYYSNALGEHGVYKHKVLDFNQHWLCGKSYEYQYSRVRYCKGFSHPSYFEKLKKAMFKDECFTDKHRIVSEPFDFNLSRFKNGDILVCSHQFKVFGITALEYSIRTKSKEPTKKIFCFWESLEFTLDAKKYPKATNFEMTGMTRYAVSDQISALKKYVEDNQIPKTATLHIIPHCMEDEGQNYIESIKSIHRKIITYVPGLYDFLDLKEWHYSNSSPSKEDHNPLP